MELGANNLITLVQQATLHQQAGPLMRGRHTLAVLSMIGVTETVDEYVAVAQRLASDASWRNAIKERMRSTKHLVYRDRACITALEEFLTRVARDRRAAS